LKCERAAKAEELRRCPDETIQDYIDNDLFRICQPAPYGGFELGYDVLCEVSQTLARGCGLHDSERRPNHSITICFLQ
jgi:3-hydroxy-9,10-secoandrosta-1,3,5(10)-triene-9,17-dione monooxygenase